MPTASSPTVQLGKKQKLRITALEKKLSKAEEEWALKAKEVEALRLEKRKAELVLIRSKVEEYEEELRAYREGRGKVRHEISFSEERELLHSLIQEAPSPTSYEAQLLLDQLLRIITFWSSESL